MLAVSFSSIAEPARLEGGRADRRVKTSSDRIESEHVDVPDEEGEEEERKASPKGEEGEVE